VPTDQRVEQRLETGPCLAAESAEVVVVEVIDNLPAQALGQGRAVVQLALDAEPFADMSRLMRV
jgi:hypothetical protein